MTKVCDHLLTIREAAGRLGMSRSYIWARLRDGTLPRIKFGRSTRIRESDLARLVDQASGEGGRP